MPDFDDLSPDEAEALAAHLASIRAKKEAKAKREAELKAKLKQAQEEAARLTAELGELDVSLEDGEDEEEEQVQAWGDIDKMSAEEKRAMAQRQAAEAGVDYNPLPGGFTEETLPRDDDPRGWDELEAALNQKVKVAPGDKPLTEDTVMPKGHGRMARRAGDGEHVPGALSATRGRTAEEELGPGYKDGVQVIKYRFKHRARNGRTLVTDETLARLHRKNPGMDEDF